MSARILENVTFYDVDGKEFLDALAISPKHNDDEVVSRNFEAKAFAKKEVYAADQRYFVKRCTSGNNAGTLANPYAPLARADEFNAFNTMTGKRYYEYTKVTEDVFEAYLKFLNTRNPSHLRNAERDYNNASR